MATTTPETITDAQIRALRDEARASGDSFMCETCEIALLGGESALRVCCKAINAAAAQEDKP